MEHAIQLGGVDSEQFHNEAEDRVTVDVLLDLCYELVQMPIFKDRPKVTQHAVRQPVQNGTVTTVADAQSRASLANTSNTSRQCFTAHTLQEGVAPDRAVVTAGTRSKMLGAHARAHHQHITVAGRLGLPVAPPALQPPSWFLSNSEVEP